MRLLADENFDRNLLQAMLRAEPNLDLIRAQDVGLRAVPDEDVLAWAAQENRVVITHDVKTLVPLANQRVAANLPMPGVLLIPWVVPRGRAIEHTLIFIAVSQPEEIVNQVVYLPYP